MPAVLSESGIICLIMPSSVPVFDILFQDKVEFGRILERQCSIVYTILSHIAI